MVKKSKLLAALDHHRGRDYQAEKKKKEVRAAEKRKRQKENDERVAFTHDEDKENIESSPLDDEEIAAEEANGDDFESFDTDEDTSVKINRGNKLATQPPTMEDISTSEFEDESDVPLSDLDEEDREDTIPHQRMTINNGSALNASRKRIVIVLDQKKQPFHFHNSLISLDQPAAELISDPNDDETRELMFYKIARDGVTVARKLLKAEGIPFTRPEDYFAEMVKTDEHMEKVKKKLYDEAAGKKAAEEARKLRDAKKFGKQVQVAKEQERAKERKSTMNKIQELKRKRKGNDTGRVTEGEDLFQEVDVGDAPSKDKFGRERGSKGPPNAKRQKKDTKFGFGGKKRFSKSGTAESSADMKGFSAKRMKGKGRPVTRPGKSRRAAARS